MQATAKGCRRVTAHVRQISATCAKSAMRKNGFLLTAAWSLLLSACGSGAGDRFGADAFTGAVPGSLFGRPVGLGVGTAADAAAGGLVPRGLMVAGARSRVRSVARCWV
jgi:hypothetical protein